MNWGSFLFIIMTIEGKDIMRFLGDNNGSNTSF